MSRPTHAPGWRTPPKSVGPIHDDLEESRLDRILYAACYTLGALTAALGAVPAIVHFFQAAPQ